MMVSGSVPRKGTLPLHIAASSLGELPPLKPSEILESLFQFDFVFGYLQRRWRGLPERIKGVRMSQGPRDPVFVPKPRLAHCIHKCSDTLGLVPAIDHKVQPLDSLLLGFP